MIALAPILAALTLAQAPASEPVLVAEPTSATTEPLPMPLGPPTSLAGGAPLAVGGSQVLGFVGYPTVGFLYAQGVGPVDVGAELALRWDSGELDAAGFVRLGLWRSGGSALALRGRLGLYAAFGPSYGPYARRSDAGLLLSPGLAWSAEAGPAHVSVGFDLRTVLTTSRGGGSIFAPTLSAGIEVPLAGDVSAGARLSAWRRWDRGGAPGRLRSPEDGAELVALIGYRLF